MDAPSERWRRIEEVCQAALDRDPAERPAFIAAACGGDSGLRRDVEALLGKETAAAGFLTAPLAAVAADAIGSVAGSSLIGRRLGVYEVVGALGAGGMGEVYRARDTELGRDVAFKMLPREFVADRDRLARFEREARVLAALNHPNIAAIYGLEPVDGVRALVLELVEGQTLGERIGDGGIGNWRSALAIARQIADALEAAHDKGIVHRDLKPANIKITPADVVKVLDFGLAKALDANAASAAAGASKSPTLTVGGTRQGVLLGTAAYMSPEQARGQSVDKRADIWAFGCVLYEMLTGRMAFAGATVSDHIAAILERDPDWAALPTTTPPAIQRLLRRCLEKDTKRRLHDIADARIEIDEAAARSGPEVESPPRFKQPWFAWSIAGALLAALLVLIAWSVVWRRPAEQRHMMRFSLQLPASWPNLREFAISPDGNAVAYSAQESAGTTPRLSLRRLDQFDAVALDGTENGRYPFFSPDGAWVGFGTGSALKKISTSAAASPIVLAEVASMRGGTWIDDGTIIVSAPDQALQRVPAAGGAPVPFAVLDTSRHERDHHNPEVLPGGKAVIFTIHEVQDGRNVFRVGIQALSSDRHRVVIDQGFDAHYVPTGHLVYANGSTLLAVAFDLLTLEATGSPVKLLDGLATEPDNGVGNFRVSASGSLVFVPERPRNPARTLVWVDRSGRESPVPLAPRQFTISRVSPDGRRIAFTVVAGDNADIWTYDIATDQARRVSFENYSVAPVWTPDGSRVTYTSSSSGNAWRLMSVPADGNGSPQSLGNGSGRAYPMTWTPDGRTLVYFETLAGQNRFAAVDVGGQTHLVPTNHGPSFADVTGPALSPDGRWLAFVGFESGQKVGNIYVEPFQHQGPRYQVTVDGGIQPIWRRDGREIFYRNDDRMYAVPIGPGPDFVSGKPVMLFRGTYRRGAPTGPDYDVTPDGSRFLMVKMGEDELAPPRLNVVLNWVDELVRRVPIGK